MSWNLFRRNKKEKAKNPNKRNIQVEKAVAKAKADAEQDDDSQLEADYAEALQLGQILVAYARLVMIGPGGVGKTSLLNGLKNIPLPLANSTQLAETSTVRPQNWSRAINDPESPWTDVTEDDETDEIVGLVQLVKNVTSTQTRSSRFVNLLEATNVKSILNQSGGQSEVKQTVDEILSRAVRVAKENPRAQAPELEVMLHVWDCGGQPVFLDVLPPFLTSKSMFMLMFDASKNLCEKCVAESHQDGAVIRSEQYHNTTTMELLLQWMATIHATLAKQKHSTDIFQQSTTDNGNDHQFPRILPIGTRGDQPSVQSRKEEILQEISSECENKAFAYLVRPGVIVDNTKAGEGDHEDPAFKEVRKEAFKFTNENLKIPTPITWVLFRKVFKILAATKPIFPLEEVIEIAVECGVREEAVGSVLKFYHDLAVFLHYAHIPSLKKYVIADVQWLINQLAKILALEGFESNRSSLLWKPLREKGILVQPLCEEVWKGSNLPPQALLDLMENFLLLAPIHSKVYPQHPGREYFIPSVLKPFNPEQDTVTPTVTLKKADPLHLTFNNLYVPPGFFSRLATLLTKEQKCHVLFKHEVYRNRISILYGGANNQIDRITISQLPCSIKIEVSREQTRLSHHSLFSSTCREVLKLIQECSVTILEWLPGIKVTPAFTCEQSSSDEGHPQHFTKFQPDATTRSSMLCEKFHPATIPTCDQQYWLKVSLNEEGMGGSLLTPSELNHLVALVPQAKIKELAECLEMIIHLTSEDSTSLHTVLSRWTKQLQDMNVTHVRPHLVHYLRMSGLQELAEKLKYGELHDSSASDATTTTSTEAPQVLAGVNTPATNGDLLPLSPDHTDHPLNPNIDNITAATNTITGAEMNPRLKEPQTETSQQASQPQSPIHEKPSDKVVRHFEPATFSDMDTSATAVWELGDIHEKLNGEGIVIAIIDNGINYFHNAFETARNEKRLAGLRSYPEKDKYTNEWNSPGGDKASHGTMAAFIAGGEAFGAVKSGGVAPKSTLVNCSVGNAYNELAIISALNKLIKWKETNHSNAPDIISMSFGLVYTPDDPNQMIMRSRIKRLRELNVVIIAAAGNSGKMDGGVQFPACEFDNVISVGAHDKGGYVMKTNASVGIRVYAPGQDIVHPNAEGTISVRYSSGSSCAAPAIAGLMALLLQFSEKYVKDDEIRKKYRNIVFIVNELFGKELRKGGDTILLHPLNFFKRKIAEHKTEELKKEMEQLRKKIGAS